MEYHFNSPPCNARVSNSLPDLYTRQAEDHGQTAPGGRPHWHTNIPGAKSGHASIGNPSRCGLVTLRKSQRRNIEGREAAHN